MNSKFVTEPPERLANELGSIIMDDSLWYAKVVYDVMLDELDHI